MSDVLDYRRHRYEVRGGVIYRDGAEVTARKLLEDGQANSGLWSWLRAHGIRRPSPSGASGPSGAARHDGEARLNVWIDARLFERLRAHAGLRRVTVTALVEELLRRGLAT